MYEKEKALIEFCRYYKGEKSCLLKIVTNLRFGVLKCFGSKIVPMVITMYLQNN